MGNGIAMVRGLAKGFAQSPTRAAWAARLLWFALVCAFPLHTIWVLWLGSSPTLVWDQWIELPNLVAIAYGDEGLAALLKPHNEHPLFVPRLFYLADLVWTSATNRVLIPGMVVIQGAACLALTAEVWRAVAEVRRLRVWVAGFYVVFLLSAAQSTNLLWGFQLAFILHFAAAAAALTAFVTSQDRPCSRSSAFALSVVWILAGLTASFSLASGVLIWPALLTVALIYRSRLRVLLGLGVLFVFTIMVASRGGAAGDTALHAAAAAGLPRILGFLALYLGLPFRATWGAAYVLGGAGLVGFIVLVWAELRLRSPMTRFRALQIGLAAFVLLVGMATSAGRAFGGTYVAIDRYTTGALYFWPALSGWAAALLPRLPESRRRLVLGIAAPAGIALVGCLAIIQLRAPGQVRRAKTARELDILPEIVGVRDRDYFPEAYPLAEWHQKVPGLFRAPSEGLALARERRLGLSAEGWTRGVGAAVAALDWRDADGWVGDVHRTIPTEDGAGLRLEGYVAPPEAERCGFHIYVVNEDGRVVGLGLPDAQGEESGAGAPMRWVAFAQGTDAARLHLFVVRRQDARAAHRLLRPAHASRHPGAARHRGAAG